MTEELNNFNTDMKELFMNNKFEEIVAALNEKNDAEIHELTFTNYEIIKKYYDLEKFDLIFTHIKFVAYTCFFCEYGHKRNLVTDSQFEEMMSIFTAIHVRLQQSH